ncbi:hypothetical protein [Anaerocolumna sp. MB42-C2]|uniref:hypothetical protein n=1 Tax=Anaerocolumna sp. MB42-C2 TaxID=3070997 RepID=UPI0027DFDBE0|nr:hypothetical protein [Anaerocolumna sp. MB42-C2]WMJ87579.1 hypothetical protein RBU59_26685 [Anaerocolumna sp. MB42-C2]
MNEIMYYRTSVTAEELSFLQARDAVKLLSISLENPRELYIQDPSTKRYLFCSTPLNLFIFSLKVS